MSPLEGSSETYEQALSQKSDEVYSFRLYVTGASRLSTQAVNNLKRVCDDYLADRYELEIVDLYQQPELAAEEQLIVAPTLVKKLPLPMCKLIGNLSNIQDVLHRLGIIRA